MKPSDTAGTRLYELLVDEEDARVCKDISEAACRETPRSFVLQLIAQFLTKLGDAIASPKTVLAWVMAAIQAPPALVGLMVPIRESGSLIPQLFIASYVRRLELRKWVWVVGAVLQGLAVVGIGLVAMRLEGTAAGWAVIGLLVVFSLARGLSSVASKDVLGKTVAKTRRGRLTGWSASAAGLVSLGVGGLLLLPADGPEGAGLLAMLLAGAGALWFAAALVYARIPEFPGETAGGGNAVTEALARLRLLVEDAPFRRFVVARSLLLCSALSAPFYVLLARERIGGEHWLLGLFVLSAGLASLLAAPFWGRFADRSSRQVMVLGGAISGGMGAVIALADQLAPGLLATAWFVPLAYFILSIAHDGVRVGRKTYIVDLAGGNKRTDYVAVSNTVIGVVLLVTGLVGLLTPIVGTGGVILILSVMGLGGAALSAALPEVQ